MGHMLLSLIALTIPLCIDSFLIAAAIGITKPSRAHTLRLSLMFAIFESGMPLVGLVIGHSISGSLGHAANLVAAGILIAYGFYSVLRRGDETETAARLDRARGIAALLIGLSVSLDGLAIGFTYGLLDVPVILVTALIFIQAFVLSQIGFAVGGSLPLSFRQSGEKLAGIAIFGIGCYIALMK